jgi:hypothetical protein
MERICSLWEKCGDYCVTNIGAVKEIFYLGAYMIMSFHVHRWILVEFCTRGLQEMLFNIRESREKSADGRRYISGSIAEIVQGVS